MTRVTEEQQPRETPHRTPWLWLAWAAPVFVGMWVVEPRLATNRPSYGVREMLILLTAVLAIPSVYAIGRVTGRQALATSWPIAARQWLWSAVVTFAALPVVLTVAGQLVPLDASYPDDKIPGLEAGLLSATAAIILFVVVLTWLALARMAGRSREVRS